MQLDLDSDTRALLERYGFDENQFSALRQRFVQGDFGATGNRLRGRVEPPADDDLVRLPAIGSEARNALAARGIEAMRRGQVGCVILAGGMATRFGGVVKAAVPAIADRSFLSLKLGGVRMAAEQIDARVPAFVMTSFATDTQIRGMLKELDCPAVPASAFAQFVSLRLRPDGEPFREGKSLSPYAPGHGDLSFALRRSGILPRFIADGGRLLYMSNVDNLAATLDPAVIGAHLASGRAVTAEVVSKDPGDAGGAPARVDGTLQIVESFRFPVDFDESIIPVFNVNSFVLDAAALDQDFPLSWFVVRKKVAGQEAIQFEHLVGELTAFLPTQCLHVEREGPDGRFQPVKDPEEARAARATDRSDATWPRSPLRAALGCMLVAAACSAVTACDNAGRRCHFGSDHSVFRSEGGVFDDVALVKASAGPMAIFSDASGLYARALDDSGLPRSRAERIGERCDAGVDAAVSGKDLWIACARRARGGSDAGSVSLYTFGSALSQRQRYVPVGGESHGVALAVQAGRVRVAWQDAALGGAQLRYAEGEAQVTRVISDPEWFAGMPHLTVTDSQAIVVWDESQEHASEYESRIRMLDLSGRGGSRSAATVLETHDASPSPAVLVDPRGGSWLAFRDRRKPRQKAGLYLAHLLGSRASEVVRVGRADGVGRPTLTACLSGLVAATPRAFAGDYFVGVIQVDPDLQTFSLEQQFYEDSHAFPQVAAACVDTRLLLLIAERGRLGGGSAALRSVGFSCE